MTKYQDWMDQFLPLYQDETEKLSKRAQSWDGMMEIIKEAKQHEPSIYRLTDAIPILAKRAALRRMEHETE